MLYNIIKTTNVWIVVPTQTTVDYSQVTHKLNDKIIKQKHNNNNHIYNKTCLFKCLF